MTASTVRARVIVNANAGKGRYDLDAAIAVLTAHGWDVTVREKRKGGEAATLAREAADEGCDVVVACGGDGTIGEVIDGIVGSDVAVGVLPAGTANLWATEIGMQQRPDRAAAQLAVAQRRRVDVGHVDVDGKIGRHFLLMAGLGIDAAVLERLNKRLKGKVGLLSYLPAIGRAMPGSKVFRARVGFDGTEWNGEVVQIVVSNTRRYAKVTTIAPEAVVDDGRLDVVLLTPTGPISAAGQLASLLLRQRPKASTAVSFQASHVTVAVDGIVPLQTDGGRVKQKKVDPAGGVTYAFVVLPHAVTVLVPTDYAGPLFQHQDEFPAGAGAPTAGKRDYRVLDVGVDTFAVERERDGWVATVRLTPESVAHGADGTELPVAALLAGLNRGARLEIRGKKQRKRHRLTASQLRLLD